jgi:hypothetical protein
VVNHMFGGGVYTTLMESRVFILHLFFFSFDIIFVVCVSVGLCCEINVPLSWPVLRKK